MSHSQRGIKGGGGCVSCKHSVNTSYTRLDSRMFLAGIQTCADGRWIPDKSIWE